MVRSRTKFPKEGEFLVGKVSDIQQQYVYVDLIDYDGLDSDECAKGFVHVSEISSRWVKNIRDYAKIGQRLVFRVLRVDPQKGQIDLSLRRVNSAQRENRMKEWKYGLKFETLLQLLSEEGGVNITFDETYELLGFPILDQFNSFQDAIEVLKESGDEILKKLTNVPENVKKAFIKIVDENVKISTVSVKGKIKLMFLSENGIDLIKESLLEARGVVKNPKETRSLKITYMGAPFYRVEIVSKDYLDAEGILSEVLEVVSEKAGKYNGQFEFIRD